MKIRAELVAGDIEKKIVRLFDIFRAETPVSGAVVDPAQGSGLHR